MDGIRPSTTRTTRAMSRARHGQAVQQAPGISPAARTQPAPSRTAYSSANTGASSRPRSATTRSMSRQVQGQIAQQIPSFDTAEVPLLAAPVAATNVTGRRVRGRGESQGTAVIAQTAAHAAASPPTPVTPRTPRRLSTWQLNHGRREAEEVAAVAADAALDVQADAQVSGVPLAAVNTQQTSRTTSPGRPRCRPLVRPDDHVRENLELEATTTPTSSGSVFLTPPATLKGDTADGVSPNEAPSSTASSNLAPSDRDQPSPVKYDDELAASAIRVGIDQWVASEQRRQIAATAAALKDAGISQRQGDNPVRASKFTVQSSITTQNVGPASVLDSEWLRDHHDTAQPSGLREAPADEFEGMLGRGLQNITDAFHSDLETMYALPSGIMNRIPGEICNSSQEGSRRVVPTPETLDLNEDLSLPFGAQAEAAPTPPAPSGAAPPYHVSNLCVDQSCPVRHRHEQGLYVADPGRPRTWNVCWGYSDPPPWIWEALTAMARGRAKEQQRFMVHGFAHCHFWPGVA